MKLVHGVLFGIGLLILMYLAVTNADGVAKIFNAGTPALTGSIKTLQGR